MASRIPRRLVPAAAVALLVALAGFGVIGIASASDPAPALQERWFQVAPRHAGDRETFQWRSEQRTADGMEAMHEDVESVAWGPEELWLDGRDGTWHAAHARWSAPWTSTFDGGDSGNEMQDTWQLGRWVDSTSDALLGHTFLGAFNWSMDWGPLTLFAAPDSITADYESVWWVTQPVCGLDVAVRAGLTLGNNLTVTDPCLTNLDTPVTFDIGVGEVDGIGTVRFSAKLETAVLNVDYHEGAPDALQVEWLGFEDRRSEPVFRAVTKLTAFQAGTGDWHSGLALPEPLTLPAIAMAPRHAWGPDEAGIDHPFPASVAWQKALDDPSYAAFRDFMGAHPDALAREGDYLEARHGNETKRTWTFHVQDDSASFLLFSKQTESPPGARITDLLGLDPTSAPPVLTYEASGQESSHRSCEMHLDRESPDKEPGALLPTPASVMARWQATVRSDTPANAWSFECGVVQAGLQHSSAPPTRAQDLVNGGLDVTTSEKVLRVDPWGVPMELQREGSRMQDAGRLEPSHDGPVVDSDSDATQPKDTLQLAAAGVVWSPPAGPAASGAAAASLVAGVLYLLWPTLKGGGLALFSRIHGSQLLDHPLRRAIVDVVEAQPGIHYQAILRTVGGGKGAVEHHLRKLADAGVLVRHKGPGYTCYFPARTDRRVAAAAGTLKASGARVVLGAVRSRPGASSAQVAAATGLDPSTVSHHVHRLAEAGLVRTTRVGRTLRIQATPLAGDALA